ncbi:unnamed protein product, partial [marine sediment metagenome]
MHQGAHFRFVVFKGIKSKVGDEVAIHVIEEIVKFHGHPIFKDVPIEFDFKAVYGGAMVCKEFDLA